MGDAAEDVPLAALKKEAEPAPAPEPVAAAEKKDEAPAAAPAAKPAVTKRVVVDDDDSDEEKPLVLKKKTEPAKAAKPAAKPKKGAPDSATLARASGYRPPGVWGATIKKCLNSLNSQTLRSAILWPHSDASCETLLPRAHSLCALTPCFRSVFPPEEAKPKEAAKPAEPPKRVSSAVPYARCNGCVCAPCQPLQYIRSFYLRRHARLPQSEREKKTPAKPKKEEPEEEPEASGDGSESEDKKKKSKKKTPTVRFTSLLSIPPVEARLASREIRITPSRLISAARWRSLF